ncbi:hypothetical protein SAMN05444000_1011 [Shimia gijangensis]|uniref:Phage integrase family protein n=1 Tax=Shimia gijangensis TaxID=1470563 RepID=A0A1M6ANX5_9RHOB|nr:hypothetical protein SAMN05444000_1011 [Shimia gijangensis]
MALEEIVSRVEELIQKDPSANSPLFAANLGGFELPDTTLNEIAEQMAELCPDKVARKNNRQRRMWHNRYKRAAATFSALAGSMPIANITVGDASNYRRSFEKRVTNQEVTTQYANKHFGYLRVMVDTYYDNLKIDEYSNPFVNVRIKGEANWEKAKDPVRKAEFSPNWIQQNIASGAKLDGLNDEARDILIVCAETGCRQTEIYDLPQSAIKLDASVPHILISVEDGEHRREIKNKASRRPVPLVGMALAAMKRNPKGFPRYRGKEGFSATVSKYFEEHNMFPTARHHVSSLRHSFESRMRRAGLTNEERGYMMGHSMKTIRGREVYGDEPDLRIRALYAELVSFEASDWKPRKAEDIFNEMDDILTDEGFRPASHRDNR